jgi:hypothetical protein
MLAVLWRYYEALLHPVSPIYVAESEAVGGLGLFVWRGAAVVMGGSLFKGHLWGVPFEVAEEDFAELQVGGYLSLYCMPDGWAHILCSPLALTNHCCATPLSFSLPKRIAVAPSSSPSPTATTSAQATHLHGGSISVEEFASLSAVYAQATQHHQVAKGQEIMVNYFGQEGRGRIHTVASPSLVWSASG